MSEAHDELKRAEWAGRFEKAARITKDRGLDGDQACVKGMEGGRTVAHGHAKRLTDDDAEQRVGEEGALHNAQRAWRECDIRSKEDQHFAEGLIGGTIARGSQAAASRVAQKHHRATYDTEVQRDGLRAGIVDDDELHDVHLLGCDGPDATLQVPLLRDMRPRVSDEEHRKSEGRDLAHGQEPGHRRTRDVRTEDELTQEGCGYARSLRFHLVTTYRIDQEGLTEALQ